MPVSLKDLVKYVTFLAEDKKWFTQQRHLISLKKLHIASKTNEPFVSTLEDFKIFMKGLKRELKTAQKEAPAFKLDVLPKAVTSQPETIVGLRTRVILLLGFTGAFRRGELSELNIEDLIVDDERMIIRMKKSKTNQTGAVEEKCVRRANDPMYCPVTTVITYLDQLGRSYGPLRVRIRREINVTDERLSITRSINLLKLHWARTRKGENTLHIR